MPMNLLWRGGRMKVGLDTLDKTPPSLTPTKPITRIEDGPLPKTPQPPKASHKGLSRLSGSGPQWISKTIFQTQVMPHSQLASAYIWNFFTDYSTSATVSISDAQFQTATEKVFAQITDKEQVNFYIKVFGRGKDTVGRNAFMEFLISAYELSSAMASSSSTGTIPVNLNTLGLDAGEGKEWIEAVTKSCYHVKEDMSSYFLSNWILTNLPLILVPMHKYIVHQLTSGYKLAKSVDASPSLSRSSTVESFDSPIPGERARSNLDIIARTELTQELGFDETDNANSADPNAISPILLWLLSASLPGKYLDILVKKIEPPPCPFTTAFSPKQLIQQLLNSKNKELPRWVMLYNSELDGSSVNRFQFHVFNYRGPTLMFIYTDNGYSFCIGTEMEWKENSRFWGGEDSILLQLQPEFHLVERGPKILYVNFSIRGYPFGIQVGKDPRNVAVEIKPDFQYVFFKKMPCKINQIIVYGCAPKHAQSCQLEFKKWEAKQCEKQRTVNRNATAEWTDNPDKYLLELAGTYKSYGVGNGST